MKINIFPGWLIAGFLAAGVQFAATADDTNAPAPAPRPERRIARQATEPNRSGTGPERINDLLTEEQRVSLRKAMESQRDQVRGLELKLREARKEIYNTGLNSKFDENAVREKAMAVAKIEGEMTVLRVKALSQIQPPLSPEQIQKLQSLPPGGGQRPLDRTREAPPANRDENGLPPKQ